MEPSGLKDEIFQKLLEHRGYLRRTFGVRRIAVFGSVARNEAGKASDVDLLVELEAPLGFRFVALADYLENLLGRKVDVITRDGLGNIRVKSVAESILRELEYVEADGRAAS